MKDSPTIQNLHQYQPPKSAIHCNIIITFLNLINYSVDKSNSTTGMVTKSQQDNSKLEEKNNYSISLINEQRTWPNSITPIQFQTLHLTLTYVYRKTRYRQTICETLIYPLKPLRLNKKKTS